MLRMNRAKVTRQGVGGVPLGERRGGVGKSMEVGLKGTSGPHRASSLMRDWAVCVFSH